MGRKGALGWRLVASRDLRSAALEAKEREKDALGS